jgi:hypothetical protein
MPGKKFSPSPMKCHPALDRVAEQLTLVAFSNVLAGDGVVVRNDAVTY